MMTISRNITKFCPENRGKLTKINTFDRNPVFLRAYGNTPKQAQNIQMRQMQKGRTYTSRDQR